MNRIKIVLVDDHRIFRDGLKSLLSEVDFIEIIGEASGGSELFESLTCLKPDLIMMDISMKGLSGIEVSRMLTASSPDVRIIILSMHTDEEFVISAIQAGVKGYLSKDASKEELLEAIKIIHEGGECYSKMISDSFLKSYARKYKAEQSLVENKTLTQREMEILKLAAVGQSNKEIADRLFISHKTVDCHKNNIVQKLKLKNTAEMVLYAVKHKIIEV